MLIDKVQLKDYLDIQTQEYDPFIESIITNNTKIIENYISQPIEATDITRYYDGNDSNMIMIKEFPVNSISRLEERSTSSATFTALATTDYFLLKGQDITHIYNCNGFTKGISNYKAVFNVGYSSIPEELQQVCIEMSAITFKESAQDGGLKGGRLGVLSLSENVSGISTQTQYKDKWKDWERIMQPYKLPLY